MQRLGLYSETQTTKRSADAIWIHAASVGEVFTVMPLLKAINSPLLVTTMSPTGAAVLEQQALPHVRHQYLPLDFPGACRRFFHQAQIREGWIVETEIWPWLFACASARQIPLTIINGRLSDKTSKRVSGLLASTYKKSLANIRVLARSNEDARRFAELGAAKASIRVVGNLKYATDNASDKQPHPASPVGDRPFVLAASTHADEELQLALAWQNLQRQQPLSILLVIVPRHPERGLTIQKDLENAGISAALRSQQQDLDDSSQYYIADTLGELQAWYASASACFIGGSLIKRGGHNVLEAARLGCPVIVGPHTFNFSDIVDTFISQNALMVAQQANEVAQGLRSIAEEPHTYQAMAQRAEIQAKASEGVLDDYLEWLL